MRHSTCSRAVELAAVASLAIAAALIMPQGVATGAAQTAPTSAERNKQIVAAAFDRWAAGGSDFFTEMLAPAVTWTIEGSGPSAGVLKSRDALLRALQPFAARFSDPVRPTSRQLWADGDHVIIHWEGKGTTRDGQTYRNRYAWIFRMQGGKAVEVNAFLDLNAYDQVLRRGG